MLTLNVWWCLLFLNDPLTRCFVTYLSVHTSLARRNHTIRKLLFLLKTNEKMMQEISRNCILISFLMYKNLLRKLILFIIELRPSIKHKRFLKYDFLSFSECPSGTFHKFGVCLKCPKGAFQYKRNQVQCENCKDGYTTLTTGSVNYIDCYGN